MNVKRKKMLSSNENLGWCKQLDFERVQIVINEGDIINLMIDYKNVLPEVLWC